MKAAIAALLAGCAVAAGYYAAAVVLRDLDEWEWAPGWGDENEDGAW